MINLGRKWEVEEIKSLIENNDKMVVRSLIKLYEYQTENEKKVGESNIDNGVGFNKYDSDFLSSIAKQYLDCNFITNKQIHCVRKRILKYSKQLTKIANNLI